MSLTSFISLQHVLNYKSTKAMVKKLYLAASIMLGAQISNAQIIDSTFGVYGIANTSFVAGQAEACQSIVLQSDGMIVAGGNSKSATGLHQFVLARYDTSGVLDNTFGTAGKVITPNAGIGNQLKHVALQPDGKILAVGIAQTAPFSPWTTLLMRYNSNGTLDNSYGINGRVTTAVGTKADAYKVLIQPDNKILICGTQYDDNYYILVRYNANGTIDNSFGTSGIVQFGQFGTGTGLALQPDGKILVSGEFWGTVVLNGPNSGVARHNADGSVDHSFGNNGVCYISALGPGENLWGGHDLKVLPDGKILLAVFGNSGSLAQKPAVVRITNSGQRDMSFGTSGFASTSHTTFNAPCEEMAIQPDGKILLVGNIVTTNITQKDSFFVSRFDTSGAPDISFGVAGRLSVALGTTGSNASTILLQPNGKFVVGGMLRPFSSSNFALYRYRYPTPVINNVKEVPNSEVFALYPNPAGDRFYVKMNAGTGEGMLSIADLMGKRVLYKMINDVEPIDISGLAAGTYVVTVSVAGSTGKRLLVRAGR